MPMDTETIPNTTKNIAADAYLELLKHHWGNEQWGKALSEILEKAPEPFLPFISFERFSEFLTLFDVDDSCSANNVVEHKVQEIRPISEGVSPALEYCNALKRTMNNRRDIHADKYAWFESSWLLLDYLSEYPNELDPGRIIAEYLKLIFPEGELEVGLKILGEYKADKTLRHNTDLYEIVVKIGAACIASSEYTEKEKACLQIALNLFLNPSRQLDLPDGITINDIIEATIKAPDGFFYSWARGWWLNDVNFSQPITTENMKKVLSLGTIIGTCNQGWGATGHSKKELFTLNLLWDLVSKSNDNYRFTTDTELQRELIDIFVKYTETRRRVFCGISPLDYTAVNQFFMFIDRYVDDHASIMDLTFLLSRGEYDFGEIYLLPEQETAEAIFEEFNEKQEMYVLLFNKCIEEGLPELANALLSLYLLARGIYCQCRFQIGKPLEEIISKGLSLPGNKTLRYTLETLVMESEKAFSSDPLAMFCRRFFKQFVPQQAQLHIIGNKVTEQAKQPAALKNEIKEKLIEHLETERWNKLSRNSQHYLLDAELLWCRNHDEFGYGIRDFSGMINGYCKVIEKELVDRLSDFFYSEEYKKFLQTIDKKNCPTKPTLGSLVQLLRHYIRFDSDLQTKLDSTSVMIQHNKELIGQLQKFISHRNTSSHSDAYDMVKFSEFKKLYFQDEMLIKFIDHIR